DVDPHVLAAGRGFLGRRGCQHAAVGGPRDRDRRGVVVVGDVVRRVVRRAVVFGDERVFVAGVVSGAVFVADVAVAVAYVAFPAVLGIGGVAAAAFAFAVAALTGEDASGGGNQQADGQARHGEPARTGAAARAGLGASHGRGLDAVEVEGTGLGALVAQSLSDALQL